MRHARLAGLALAAVLAVASHAADRAHVYLVIVDGLDARFATRGRMPELFAALGREPERSSFFPGARAVMPARTNPNHASLLTGAYAGVHGITGNAYWSRAPGRSPAKLDQAAQVEVETLFTVAAATRGLRTLGVFAKPKLARLFGAVPGRQRAPDTLWSPDLSPSTTRDRATGYSFDRETMTAALGLAEEAEPDLAVITLADVDRTGHARGPESPDYEQAVRGADAALGRLVRHLEGLGRWGDSVLVVTADHGFTSLVATSERPHPTITLGPVLERAGIRGVRLVADGGVEHVYGEEVPPEATSAGEGSETLARVAALAREVPGVAEVLARLPVPGVAPLEARHPDWHLAHERTGELLLVAAPGHQFVDPFDAVDAGLLGNHGGPGELAVPLAVTGGSPLLVAAPAGAPPPVAVDVAATIGALLGLRPPRRLDGRAMPPEALGRPISGVLAERPAQSPH